MIPKLGRHYSEVWEDDDMALYPPGGLPAPQITSPSFAAPVPKWDPSTLMEPDLLTEEKGHGPLTERLISALLPMPDMTVWKGVKAAEDAMEGRPGGSGAAAARREKMNVSDLEERIRDTMRFHGLLDGAVSCDFKSQCVFKLMDLVARLLRESGRPHCYSTSTCTARPSDDCGDEQKTERATCCHCSRSPRTPGIP